MIQPTILETVFIFVIGLLAIACFIAVKLMVYYENECKRLKEAIKDMINYESKEKEM